MPARNPDEDDQPHSQRQPEMWNGLDQGALPSPDTVVYLIGVLEIVGGALLIVGLATRLAALLLAGNMLAAIIVSGIGEGEVLPSLTLAPLLLAAMLFLLYVGPGARAVDGCLLRSRAAWS